VVKSQA